MYNWTALDISAFPRGSGTKIKKMNDTEDNLAIPVWQADVTGCQNDTASEKTTKKDTWMGNLLHRDFLKLKFCRKVKNLFSTVLQKI